MHAALRHHVASCNIQHLMQHVLSVAQTIQKPTGDVYKNDTEILTLTTFILSLRHEWVPRVKPYHP